MRLFRLYTLGCLLLTVGTLSACLMGGGSPAGVSPEASPGITPSGVIGAPPPGSTGAAASGDTMPPRPDAGDKMPAVGPKLGDWRITYFSSPTANILGSRYSDEPAILPCEGKTALDGVFLVELGEADQGCDNASCWRWSIVPENQFVRVKLTRKTADKTVEYYQDFRVGAIQPDGSNLKIGGIPIENNDVLYFAYTGSEDEPPGYAATLTELTDEAQKFANTVYLGYFKVQSAASIYRRDFLHAPLDDLGSGGDIFVK